MLSLQTGWTEDAPTEPSARRDSGLFATRLRLPSHLRVLRILGEGGTSIVYEAFHERLKLSVAVKVHKRGLDFEGAEQRLVREAELCVRLSDPRFPRVYDVDELPD